MNEPAPETDRDRQLRHAADQWEGVLTDWQKIRAGFAVLKKHRPPTSEDGVVDEALAVLQDERRWGEIHPDGTFSTVREATLKQEAAGDALTTSVLSVLENLLKTAYNTAWRPGMFPPFDADARDWIFTCLRQLSDLLDGAADVDLLRPDWRN